MAIKAIGSSKPTEKGTVEKMRSKPNNEKEKDSISYANNNGFKLWSDESLLSISLKKNNTRDIITPIIKITNLDENKKFVKDSEGKIDQGYFNLSIYDIQQMLYYLNYIIDSSTTYSILEIVDSVINKFAETNNLKPIDIEVPSSYRGLTLIHDKKEENDESTSTPQLEIIQQEDGIYIWIEYIKDNNIETEWHFKLDSTVQVSLYDEEGNIEKISLNSFLFLFRDYLNGMIALITTGNNLTDFSSYKKSSGAVNSNKVGSAIMSGSNDSNLGATKKLDKAMDKSSIKERLRNSVNKALAENEDSESNENEDSEEDEEFAIPFDTNGDE